jgi:hypothetical protein
MCDFWWTKCSSMGQVCLRGLWFFNSWALEDKGSTFLETAGLHWPSDMASCSKRPVSSTTPLWELPIFQPRKVFSYSASIYLFNVFSLSGFTLLSTHYQLVLLQSVIHRDKLMGMLQTYWNLWQHIESFFECFKIIPHVVHTTGMGCFIQNGWDFRSFG